MADDADLETSLKAAAGESTKPTRPAGGLTPPRKPGISNVARAAAPAAHKAAAVRAAEVEDAFPHAVAARLALVGAGQGGGRLAQAFWDLGYRRVAAFNTTDSDFDGLAADMAKLSLHIGGAAKDMTLARNAMKGRDEEVWDLFTRAWGTKVDYALVCVGLGGGTGSGAALPLVRLARKYMEARGLPPRVGAVVSLPAVSDGQKIAHNAVTAFGELLEAKVSPLLVIDNDKVHELYHPPYSELLPKSNSLVSEMLHLFNQLAATKSRHVTFDRAELAQLLDGGLVVMGAVDLGVADIRSPADVSAAIKDQLAAGVLADVDLTTGRAAACVFVADPVVLDTFDKEYFDAGFTMLNRMVGAAHPEGTEVIIHRGVYPDGQDGLQCYTMISSLDPPRQKLQALSREAGLARGQAPAVARHLNVD